MKWLYQMLVLDSLFEAQPSFIRSLTLPQSDGTSLKFRNGDCSDYYFSAELERFGNGIFCDGLTSPGAITISFQSNAIHPGTYDPYFHPDFSDNTVNNTQPINIMSVEDFFWMFTTDKCTTTVDVYTPDLTETK